MFVYVVFMPHRVRLCSSVVVVVVVVVQRRPPQVQLTRA